MSIKMILLPLFIQVALTFVILFWMARSRIGALKAGQVKMGDVALGQTAWPTHAQQVSNNYHSQLQLPVLFYVLTLLAIATRQADLLFVVMAWLFVVSRLAHAYVHTTTNYMRHRFNAFAAGVFILLAMWVIFAVRILLATA
ncbi:MAPEG family protein [Undibacter mobilis]|uniref:MAPEG family protein n=1 Tax=Undibacter mobilis TaxID=2292256 RepID=A0A371B2Y5_9BRAD|nr:MAPEG family protein [Undibacter mobilis]RDV01892.1 MAPEG family protein [Undibacter mobilis]